MRGIGLDIGTLRAQYQRTLMLSYWGLIVPQELVQRYFDIIRDVCFLLDPTGDLIQATFLDVIVNL